MDRREERGDTMIGIIFAPLWLSTSGHVLESEWLVAIVMLSGEQKRSKIMYVLRFTGSYTELSASTFESHTGRKSLTRFAQDMNMMRRSSYEFRAHTFDRSRWLHCIHRKLQILHVSFLFVRYFIRLWQSSSFSMISQSLGQKQVQFPLLQK